MTPQSSVLAIPPAAISRPTGLSPIPPNRDELKRAFAHFPSGVVIVTARDAEGNPHGFTASTFVPLSLDPPMVMVCLSRSAQCYDVFVTAERFAVSVLRPEHRDLAMRFATRGADKFAEAPVEYLSSGLPVLKQAVAIFEGRTEGRHPGGDHIIITGIVERAHCEDEGAAMIHFMRAFHQLAIQPAA